MGNLKHFNMCDHLSEIPASFLKGPDYIEDLSSIIGKIFFDPETNKKYVIHKDRNGIPGFAEMSGEPRKEHLYFKIHLPVEIRNSLDIGDVVTFMAENVPTDYKCVFIGKSRIDGDCMFSVFILSIDLHGWDFLKSEKFRIIGKPHCFKSSDIESKIKVISLNENYINEPPNDDEIIEKFMGD